MRGRRQSWTAAHVRCPAPQSVAWNEAVKINGADPDFHRRDLWDAIGSGDYPQWELALQLFDDEFADQFEFDVLDPTKIIPEERIPVLPVGRLVLDRVVDNFFAETEQVAFCTQNVVPGIDFTNDPLLQGRNFSYLDTQVKRLGFVTDAVAHCKFIGYTSGAAVLFETAGLPADPASADEGFISLSEHLAAEFIARCRQLRHWQRELAVAG